MECVTPSANLIEPANLVDVFVTDIGDIQALGSCSRFLLVAENPVPYADQPEQIVAVRLIIPIDRLPRMIMKSIRFALRELCRDVGRSNEPALRH